MSQNLKKQKLPKNQHPTSSAGMRKITGISISLPSLTNLPFFFFFFFFTPYVFLTFLPAETSAADTFTSSQSLMIGQTLVSSNDVFQLGFFTLDNSSWYVGIWYKNIPDTTYVWVANRDSPLKNSSSGILRIGDGGNLVILEDGPGPSSGGSVLWSSNQTAAINPVNPVAQLLDTGNLVVREASDEQNFLWQSFDFPTDTLLPDMKLGWDLNSGLNRYLTSWNSAGDPSTGDYSFKLNLHGFPEAFLDSRKQQTIFRSGPWDGAKFSGIPEMESTGNINFTFIFEQKEVSLSYHVNDPSLTSRLTLNANGSLQSLAWVEDKSNWSSFWDVPKDQCDQYSLCGPNGICNMNTLPVCKCPSGFSAWFPGGQSNGCHRQTILECSTDGFLALKRMKLPSSTNAYFDKAMSVEECQRACAKNCSCKGFSTANISNEKTGCTMWDGDLLDMQFYENGAGQDIYVRMAASDLKSSFAGKPRDLKVVLATTLSIGLSIIALSAVLLWMRVRKRRAMMKSQEAIFSDREETRIIYNRNRIRENLKLHDLKLLRFEELSMATDSFCSASKLGSGGFGPVYMGKLLNGQEIAVKRLSRASGQGLEEFMNEVAVISKVQHRNLVRLLGCCIEREEKILVYEFMPNKSLDAFLFDPLKQRELDWSRRFRIIDGICRGLLYLHRDSRLRIIHRDLKASNILLDKELNPKISDFGMARIFVAEEDQANTRRIVGTYGYMAPEYAMKGLFSEKSDVFSFGVLLLEIVSGRRNTSFTQEDQSCSLLGFAWKLWKEGDVMALVDPLISDDSHQLEVLRCIHVGLLCTQELAKDRPTTSTVVSMLNSEIVDLPRPKNPAFAERHVTGDTDSRKPSNGIRSVNQVTITTIEGR